MAGAQSRPMDKASAEIAATAAGMVVEEGLEYGAAKRRALKQLGLGPRARLPDNDAVEDAVREYLDLFCSDTQPAELRALRELAAIWMERLAEFRPHLTGAIWRGRAFRTRRARFCSGCLGTGRRWRGGRCCDRRVHHGRDA